MSLIQEALEKTGRLPQSIGVQYPRAKEPKLKPQRLGPPPPKPAAPREEKVQEERVRVRFQRRPDSRLKQILPKAWIGVFAGFILLALLWGSYFVFIGVGESPAGPSKGTMVHEVQAESKSLSQSGNIVPSVPGFKLSGITTSGGKRLALINNGIFAKGDPINGNTIVQEIQTRRVILMQGSREVILDM